MNDDWGDIDTWETPNSWGRTPVPLLVLDVHPAGVTDVLTAAEADGHAYQPDPTTYVRVRNDGEDPVDVTLYAVETVSDHNSVIPPNVVTVPAGADKLIGPLPQWIYTGDLAFSATDDVTVGVRSL